MNLRVHLAAWPTVIIEILSKSTEAYDRGEKFARYDQMESFSDYLLVSQVRPGIEHFTRLPNGDWMLHKETKVDGTIAIQSIDCTLPLEEVYDRINFAEFPAQNPPIEV